MAQKLRPAAVDHQVSDSLGGGGDGDIPRIIVADLGFPGAGWDVVDGRPVVVVDESLSGKDITRYLAVALNDIYDFVRFRNQGCAEVAYTATG